MPQSVATPRRRAGSVKMIWNARPDTIFDPSIDVLAQPRSSLGGALDPSIDIWVARGEQQALPGQNAFIDHRPHIASDQVIVEAATDGSAIYIYAQGNAPTG